MSPFISIVVIIRVCWEISGADEKPSEDQGGIWQTIGWPGNHPTGHCALQVCLASVTYFLQNNSCNILLFICAKNHATSCYLFVQKIMLNLAIFGKNHDNLFSEQNRAKSWQFIFLQAGDWADPVADPESGPYDGHCGKQGSYTNNIFLRKSL